MDERVREILAGEEAWIVGGAVRDELLGRPVLDLDVACRDPREAAHRYASRVGGAAFPLSERHGAWRVVVDGTERTVDFTPLPNGIEADLATRDFTFNAIAVPVRAATADPTAVARTSRAGSCARSRPRLRGRPAPAPARGAPRGRARASPRRADRGAATRVVAARDPCRPESGRSSSSAACLPAGTAASPTSGSSRRSEERSTTRLDALDDPDFRLVAVFASGCRRSPSRRTSVGMRGAPARAAGLRTRRRVRSIASVARPSRGRSTRSRSSGRRAHRRRGGPPPGGPRRAARPRGRARSAARARDRTYPRRHRRGARSGDDLNARGGARARAVARRHEERS